MQRSLAILTVIIASYLVVPSLAIEAKCSACKAVAAELQRRISLEKPRNHLDMRHRLDSTGQRYGKVISYKVSELRAVELMDNLCSEMKDYSLLKLAKSVPAAPIKGDTDASSASGGSASSRQSTNDIHIDTAPAGGGGSGGGRRGGGDAAASGSGSGSGSSTGSIHIDTSSSSSSSSSGGSSGGGGGASASQGRSTRGPGQREEEARGKQLESYCGAVLEGNEEAVFAGIMRGAFDAAEGSPDEGARLVCQVHMLAGVTTLPTLKAAGFGGVGMSVHSGSDGTLMGMDHMVVGWITFPRPNGTGAQLRGSSGGPLARAPQPRPNGTSAQLRGSSGGQVRGAGALRWSPACVAGAGVEPLLCSGITRSCPAAAAAARAAPGVNETEPHLLASAAAVAATLAGLGPHPVPGIYGHTEL
ncbi:MAG: hypothetical protein WDW36_003335 [Sanguina aurantia]